MKIITQFKIMYQIRKRVESMRILLLLLPLLFLGADFPLSYPKETLNMSKVEFFNWAVNRNKLARETWTKEYNKNIDDLYNYGSRQIEVSETTGSSSGTSIITPLSVSQSPGYFSSTTRIKRYTNFYRYKNPNFRHPGPLTLINPYVSPRKLDERN